MSELYTPDRSNAKGFAFPLRIREDQLNYSAYNQVRWEAKFGAYEFGSEIAALSADRVAALGYSQALTCGAGDAVGNAVRISGNDTVTKALATTAANGKVFAFIAHKGPLGAASVAGATTCYVVHFAFASGLSGGTAGGACYLQNDGSFGAAPGTVSKIVGEFISATEALLYADAVTAASGVSSSLHLETSAAAAFDIKAIEELVTLTGVTTPTAANHLLQYRKIIGVAFNVQTLIPNARTFKLGVTGDLALFAAAGTSGALGTKGHMWQVGLDEFLQTEADAPIVITASNADAAGGKIRVTTFYKEITPPQS